MVVCETEGEIPSTILRDIDILGKPLHWLHGILYDPQINVCGLNQSMKKYLLSINYIFQELCLVPET